MKKNRKYREERYVSLIEGIEKKNNTVFKKHLMERNEV